MEHCYLVSTSVLEEMLDSLATPESVYAVIPGDEIVTVVRYGIHGVLNQFAFPVAYRIPEVPEEEGTMLLMVGTERSKEWQNFWQPLESRLESSSISPLA